MKLNDLIQFWGHSSIYLPFDDFLMQNGIKWRPNLKRDLDTTHFIKGQGLSIRFSISAEKDGIQKKSEGNFILKQVEATIMDNGNGAYGESIPFGIAQSDKRMDIEKKIGAPKRRNKDSDNYFIDGLVWTFAFEGMDMGFIQIRVPTNGLRAHGIAV
jgi:hypothetical protein